MDISTLLAQADPVAGGGGGGGAAAAAAEGASKGPGAGVFVEQMLIFGAIFLVFWFLILRPQQKRAKEHKNLVQSLNKGDEVITSGGILGRVTKVTDDFVVLEISGNLEIKLQKQSVQATLPKGTIKSI